jgi:hypothetical protein
VLVTLPKLPCVIGFLALTVASHQPARALAEEKYTVEKIEYKGWKNNLRVSNGDAELIITLDVGPRIISYKLAGGKNVFKEFEDTLGKTDGKDWVSYGGHRLWVGPEDLTRTYAPDNGPVDVKTLESLPPHLVLTSGADKEYGIQRSMRVMLANSGSKVEVLHAIKNIGDKETELAPWALTVMAPGGVEVIPLPEKKPHPGPPKNARSPKDYAPNQLMSIWPFTDFKDGRWNIGTKYITLRQDPKQGPTKIGLAHKLGWVGYLNGGTLFVKHIGYQEGKTYPDQGVNFETFTNEEMLEIESMGPMIKLAPGAAVEHKETWELFKDVEAFKDEEGIDKQIKARIEKK